MIIEQHYDEEVLIGLLEEADHDSHVPGCETCAGTLESLRDLTSALRDNSVWDDKQLSETPAPKTTNMLRAFAERTKQEDAAAGPIVAKLIASPALINEHPEWRTAGVVRRLLAHSEAIGYKEPKRAVEVCSLAVAVAEAIESTYPRDFLAKLRATALREKAWNLFYIGSFRDSIAALDSADLHLSQSMVSECERAEVALLRARVYRDIEKYTDAIQLAREAGRTFRAYGNRRRSAVAEAVESSVLMHLRRYREALAIDSPMASDTSLDEESRASALNRTAYSLRELAEFGESKRRFAEAIQAFERLGLTDKRSMARWGLARVFLYEGTSYDSALSVFIDLRNEFEELGMAHDMALVSLDAVEALLALERPAQVSDLCRSAIAYFQKAGLTYSASAMTALSYLQEVSDRGVLTPAAIRDVRAYFEVLPKQPNLLFAVPA